MCSNEFEKLKTFGLNTDGTVTVEFALWVPVLFAILAGAADVVTLFYNQQLMYDQTYAAARQVSLGIEETFTIESFVEARFDDADNYDATPTVSDGYVTSRLSVPYPSVTAFADTFFSRSLVAETTIWVEAVSDDS